MNFSEFQALSKQTESLPAQRNARIDKFTTAALLARVINYSECLQMIKKATFYDKPIESIKWRLQLEAAQDLPDSYLSDEPPDPDKYKAVELPVRLFHALLSLVSESGEIAEIFLNMLERPEEREEYMDKLKAELGDLEWSRAILYDVLGVTEEEIWALNRAKLDARYPNGRFSKKRA